MENEGSRRRIVGEYIIGPRIGSGSFSVVWKARHCISGAEFAIKEIERKQVNEALLKEIDILRKINHPNIIRLFDAIEVEERVYLVLEYCDGGDLAGYVKRCGRVSEDVARHFMRQLAAGLQVLHENHLIHRDLKPQNLLLSSKEITPSLKIADFGFARYLKPQGLADTLCGSPLYMAPEIIRNQKYDAKADLWSVGAILYQLVTGRPPFGGNTQIELFRNILRSSQLQFPESALKILHSDCIELCRSLLRHNPVERITFEEFFNHRFLASTRVIEDAEQSPSASDVISVAENMDDQNRSSYQKDQHDTSGTRLIQRVMPNTSCNKISCSLRDNPYASVQSKVVDTMGSIERDYVLVDSHFASMETVTSLEASLPEIPTEGSCVFPAMRKPEHMPSVAHKMDMGIGTVGGMESTSSCELDSLKLMGSQKILREVQRISAVHPSTRLQLLHQYIGVVADVATQKHNDGSYLDSFSVELVVLAIWKEVIQICNSWHASTGACDISATSTSNITSHLEDVVSSPNAEETPDFMKLSSVSSWALRGFIAACDRAEMLAEYLRDMDGTSVLPDAMDIIFQTALEAGKLGAVDELMDCSDHAEISYTKAMILLMFILEEAPSLPLKPPFVLSTANKQRIQKYMKSLQSHRIRSQMSRTSSS